MGNELCIKGRVRTFINLGADDDGGGHEFRGVSVTQHPIQLVSQPPGTDTQSGAGQYREQREGMGPDSMQSAETILN